MHKPWRATAHPRKSIRDFHRAHYGNPLFNRQRATPHVRRGPDRRPLIAAICACIVLVGALWYALWGPAFRITTINITGVTGASADAIRAGLDEHLKGSAFLILPRVNILIFDKTKAVADINKKVYLDSITLRKKLPSTLEVEAHEKTTRAALDWNNRLFSLDDAGYVLRELSDEEIEQLGELPPGMGAVPVLGLGAETVDLKVAPVAVGLSATATPAKPSGDSPHQGTVPMIIGGGEGKENATDTAAIPGKAMFTAATMRTILQAHARLPDVAGSAIRWFRVQESSETVEADMAGDWRILLASANPFDIQAERLGIVLKEKIGARKPSLEYVDLRYSERIFFRLREAAPAK